MAAFLKKLLGEDKPAAGMERDDLETRIRVATCAILVEIANADDAFTDEERKRIVEILKNRFSLTDPEAKELIEITEKQIKGSIDIYGFTSVIKKSYSRDDRILVLEEVWRVVFADNNLSGHEDTLMHKLSFLLGLSHKELIDSKLKAKKGG